jgi:hypothetical protein
VKKLVSLLPQRAKLALLQWHFAQRLSGEYRGVAIVDRPDGSDPLRVSLRKNNSDIVVALDIAAATARPAVYRMLYARVPAALAVFARTKPAVRAAAADVSDGMTTRPGELAFCSNRDDAILVPDPLFVNSDGYVEFRRTALSLPWARRRDTVLWRGTSTGAGQVTTETMAADDRRLRPRVRMCLMLRAVPGTDVKIRKTEFVSAVDRQRLVSHGVVGGKIRQSDWGCYKLAIDIDGHSNAWSNFFVRLLLGCCVIKVESETGFRQWYYDRLTPWRHYVPVNADMSDLIEKIAWCRGHDAACAAIAANGQALARAMTIETEIADAVRRLEAAQAAHAGALVHADGAA